MPRKRAEHSYLVNTRFETYSSHVLDRDEIADYGISVKVNNGTLELK